MVVVRLVRGSTNLGTLWRTGRNGAGAFASPFVQALASFLLQVVAVRDLGASGFGIYALLYNVLVIVAALCSGLVGDSLTVLDRADAAIRHGLVIVTISAFALTLVSATLGTYAFTDLGFTTASVFAFSTVGFVGALLLKRLLSANLMFWRVVVVDTLIFVATVILIIAWKRVGNGPLQLNSLLAVLFISQFVGVIAAVFLMPTEERKAPIRPGARTLYVLRFGFWRALQQVIRPAALMGFRSLVVLAVGTARFGELEAARTFSSATMLIVNGAASFTLASFSAQQHKPLRDLVRRADISMVLLLGGLLPIGVAALVALPVAGPVITGGDFDLHFVAVTGWIFYSGVAAMIVPHSSLASVKGHHVLVTVTRIVDLLVSLGVLAFALWVLKLDVDYSPFAMSVGAVLIVILTRQVLVRDYEAA